MNTPFPYGAPLPNAAPRRCFLCETEGILTLADGGVLAAGPIRVDLPGTDGSPQQKQYPVCKGCFKDHYRALERRVPTAFDEFFALPEVDGRADQQPRKPGSGLRLKQSSVVAKR